MMQQEAESAPVEIKTVAEDIADQERAIAADQPAGGVVDAIADHTMQMRKLNEAMELRRAKITTYVQHLPPDCWVDMGGRPYIEGQGVMGLFEALGIVRVDEPDFEWFNDAVSKKRTCKATLRFRNRFTGQEYPPIIGTRSVGGIMDSDADLLKAAQKNAFHHAGIELLGLGGLSWKELKDWAGIEPATTVRYDKGSKGGKHSNKGRDGVAILPRWKMEGGGQPVTEVADQALEKFGDLLWKHVQDPQKARYRDSNQALVDAIRAELERRNPAG